MNSNAGCWAFVVLAVIVGVCGMMVSGKAKERPHVQHRPQQSATVSTKIDLAKKLNPAILPDVVKAVLEDISKQGQEPKSDEFQKLFLQTLSKRIMEDKQVNYRVDLNEDGHIDPVLIMPESIKDEATVYSVRVPDPQKNRTDPAPSSNPDWGKLTNEGIELLALTVIVDPNAKRLTVDAEANRHVYEGSRHHHYRSHYYHRHHSWLGGYFAYRFFGGSFGRPHYSGWYNNYYAGWHAPTSTRLAEPRVTSYRAAQGMQAAALTPSGQAARSTRAASRTTKPPAAVQALKARRVAQARQVATRRTTSSRPRTTRRTTYRSSRRTSSYRGSSFRGRSGGWGK